MTTYTEGYNLTQALLPQLRAIRGSTTPVLDRGGMVAPPQLLARHMRQWSIHNDAARGACAALQDVVYPTKAPDALWKALTAAPVPSSFDTPISVNTITYLSQDDFIAYLQRVV